MTAGQTCDELLTGKGGDGKLSGADVGDLISADNRAWIKTCLAALGKDPLDTRVAEQLWRDLVKVRLDVESRFWRTSRTDDEPARVGL